MIVKIDDWIFDVDMSATMEYSAKEAAEHCDCAYCRNFYASIDDAYPHLRPFLAQFGVDIEGPDELMPYDLEDKLYIDGFYAVCGRILQEGRESIVIDDAVITPDRTNAIGINTWCPEPYFLLNMDHIVLPWVLDEPMEDVISPANEPSFLKRMWNKLLRRQDKDIMSS